MCSDHMDMVNFLTRVIKIRKVSAYMTELVKSKISVYIMDKTVKVVKKNTMKKSCAYV